ncbi:unnamed protein product, partial [Closterium sp. Naga37s-1]
MQPLTRVSSGIRWLSSRPLALPVKLLLVPAGRNRRYISCNAQSGGSSSGDKKKLVFLGSPEVGRARKNRDSYGWTAECAAPRLTALLLTTRLCTATLPLVASSPPRHPTARLSSRRPSARLSFAPSLRAPLLRAIAPRASPLRHPTTRLSSAPLISPAMFAASQCLRAPHIPASPQPIPPSLYSFAPSASPPPFPASPPPLLPVSPPPHLSSAPPPDLSSSPPPPSLPPQVSTSPSSPPPCCSGGAGLTAPRPLPSLSVLLPIPSPPFLSSSPSPPLLSVLLPAPSPPPPLPFRFAPPPLCSCAH